MKLFKFLQTAQQRVALTRTRNILMKMSDSQLEDIGYSRHLLERGIGAWPWRLEDDATSELAMALSNMRTIPTQQASNEVVAENELVADVDQNLGNEIAA